MESKSLPVPSLTPLGLGEHPEKVCILGATQGEDREGLIPWRTDLHTGFPPCAWSLGPPLAAKGLEGVATYPPHQYHATHASCSSSTKQGVSSTLKKATPTMFEMESCWFFRHCWNLPQSRQSGPRPRGSPGSSSPPSHYSQLAWGASIPFPLRPQLSHLHSGVWLADPLGFSGILVSAPRA